MVASSRGREFVIWSVALFVAVVVGNGIARHPAYMVGLAVAIGVGAFLARRRGNGFLVATALAFSVPYWTNFGNAHLNAERLALVVACAGLVAGGWWSRPSIVDLAVIGVAAVHITSWTSSRDGGVSDGLLIGSVIPLVLYLIGRVSVSWQSVHRWLWVLLLSSTVAALTVLYEYLVAGLLPPTRT